MTQFYITAALVTFIVAPLIIFTFKFLFKKTIFYTITVVIVLNSLVAAVCGLFIGFSQNIWYLIPCSIIYTIGLFFSIRYLKASIGGPLSRMTSNIELLSKGDFSVPFEEAIARKEHELGYISKALISMLANLKESVYIAELVSNGKLFSAAKESDKKARQGDLDIALQSMLHQLDLTVSNISERSSSIALGSEEINKNSQVVAQGATEQASSLEEISSSLEQMTGNISQNAENALLAEEISKEATIKMDSVKTSSITTFTAINEIADKIQVINEIADKTNLLAINAAVEAARAGEHGKGFAVVATEVRKLAERSSESAETIIKLAKKCVIEAKTSGHLLDELTPSVQKAYEYIQEISSGSAEQRGGVEQINAALNQLNQATQQYASSAEELSSSADSFNAHAIKLKEDVSFFKLSKENEQNFSREKVLEQIEKLKLLLNANEIGRDNIDSNKIGQGELRAESDNETGPVITLEDSVGESLTEKEGFDIKGVGKK